MRHCALLVRKLAGALRAAHGKGIVHRDLKPANVMIDQDRELVIMDFGLARQVNLPEGARLTQSGAILGPPAYMSPEQVEGHPDRIGPPSDIYSLGVVLYELLTGRLPFNGSVAAVLGQIATADPPPPSELRADVDPRLETICLKMMAKSIDARYGSMAEVADAVNTFLKDLGTAATGSLHAPAHEAKRASSPAAVRKSAGKSKTAIEPSSVVRLRRLAGTTGGKIGIGTAAFLLLAIALAFSLRSGDDGTAMIERDAPPVSLPTGNQQVAAAVAPEPTPAAVPAAPAPEPESYVLHFDTDDSRVDLPLTYDGSHPITLEAIVLIDEKTFSEGRPRGILGNDGGWPIVLGTIKRPLLGANRPPSGPPELIDSLQLVFGIEGETNRFCSVPNRPDVQIQCGRFIHLAAVFDGEHLSVFEDGLQLELARPAKSHNASAALPLSIGNTRNPGSTSGRASFFGQARMVRISKAARYHRNFVPPEHYEPDEDTTALYLFEEGEGIVLKDSSGNGHHGRIAGPKWVRVDHDGPLDVADKGGEERFRHQRAVNAVIFSPDGRLIASGDVEGIVKLWDAATGDEQASLTHQQPVAGLAFNAGGDILASWAVAPRAGERTVKFWDVAAATERRHFLGFQDGTLTGPVAFSGDGRWLVTAGDENRIRVLNLESPQTDSKLLAGHTADVTSLAFSGDSTLFASGSADSMVIIWDLEQPAPVQTLQGRPGGVFPQIHALAFTADDAFLVTGGNDLMGWKVASGERAWSRRTHTWGAFALALSRDEGWLVSTGHTGDPAHAVVTSIEDGSSLRTLSGWKGARSLSLSPDGRTLATAGPDNRVRLWNTQTWQPQ